MGKNDTIELNNENTKIIIPKLVPLMMNWKQNKWEENTLLLSLDFLKLCQYEQNNLQALYTDDFHIFLIDTITINFSKSTALLINLCILNQEETFKRFATLSTWKPVLKILPTLNIEGYMYAVRLIYYFSNITADNCGTKVFEEMFKNNKKIAVQWYTNLKTYLDIKHVLNDTYKNAAHYCFRTLLVFTTINELYLYSNKTSDFQKILTLSGQILKTPLTQDKTFDEKSANNSKSTLLSLKIDIINLLSYTPKLITPSFTEELLRNWSVVLNILEVLVFEYDKHENEDETICCILNFFNEVLKINKTFRSNVKKKLFGKLADISNDTKRDYMQPILDKEKTLRNILISWCQIYSEAIKRKTGDLLWTICGDDQDEFVRLIGMGPGIGYLKNTNKLDLGNLM